jgi:hypothetical protein
MKLKSNVHSNVHFGSDADIYVICYLIYNTMSQFNSFTFLKNIMSKLHWWRKRAFAELVSNSLKLVARKLAKNTTHKPKEIIYESNDGGLDH